MSSATFASRPPKGRPNARVWLTIDQRDAAGFRHAPRFNERESETLLDGLVQLGLHARTHAELHGVLPFFRRHGLVEEHRRHHAEVVDDRGAGGDDVVPPPRRTEALGQDQAVRREHRAGRGERLAVHVIERQRIEDPLAPLLDDHEPADVAIPGAGGQIVAVGQDAALGPARRSGCVEQAALRVEAGRPAPRRHARHRQRRGPVLRVHDGQRLCALTRDDLDVGHARRDDDGEVGVRVLHLIEHLVTTVVGVDRHDAGAKRVEREVVEEELRPVFQQQGDAVAVTEARGLVGGAQTLDLGARLTVRVLDALGMVRPVRRGRRTEERGIRRGDRGRGECLIDRFHRRRRF